MATSFSRLLRDSLTAHIPGNRTCRRPRIAKGLAEWGWLFIRWTSRLVRDGLHRCTSSALS